MTTSLFLYTCSSGLSSFLPTPSAPNQGQFLKLKTQKLYLFFSLGPIGLSLPVDINLGMLHRRRAKGRRICPEKKPRIMFQNSILPCVYDQHPKLGTEFPLQVKRLSSEKREAGQFKEQSFEDRGTCIQIRVCMQAVQA